MLNGNSGMGSKKHGQSGYTPKSPKFRHHMKMEAEKHEIKPKPTNCKFNSMAELMKSK